jgi:hypothetical protein
MNSLKELNGLVTNAAMFCYNMATIKMAYNHKIGHRSKYIDVAYHLVFEHFESRPISVCQVELAEILAEVFSKELSQETL